MPRPPALSPAGLLACLTLAVALTASACAQEAAGREPASREVAPTKATAGASNAEGAATAGEAPAMKIASPGGATTPSGGAAEGAVDARGAVLAPLAVLAEAKDPDAPVVVQVLDARRATADTVRIRLAFVSKVVEPPPSSQPQSDPQPQAQSQTVPLFSAGTNPADFCLVTADGNRRLFLLRDAQNNPVLDGSLQPLRPGERRVLDGMFPAPPVHPGQSSQSSQSSQSGQSGQSGQAERVTLRLGKLTLRNIPITLTQ